MENEDKDKQQRLWHQDPANRKLGIFYFNKADTRILPPKRIKQLGWTLNFAHWQAWVILLLIIVLIAFLSKAA